VSPQDITESLTANSHTMFILKEIAPDIMYVQRQNVISVYSGTNQEDLIASIYYNDHKEDGLWTEG
jgi:hypothetical protein